MFAVDDEIPKPNNFEGADPEAEEDATAIEVSLTPGPTASATANENRAYNFGVGGDEDGRGFTSSTAVEARLSNFLGRYLTSKSTASEAEGVGRDANIFSSFEFESQASEAEANVTPTSYGFSFSLRRLVYLSIIIAAFVSTIAIVSKVQHHKKISAQMMLEDECVEVPPIVGSKSHKATPVPVAVEVVPVTVPVTDSNKIVPDFFQTPLNCNAMTGCKLNGDLCTAENDNTCKGNPNSNTPVLAECCSVIVK